jgi:hypothetical protein
MSRNPFPDVPPGLFTAGRNCFFTTGQPVLRILLFSSTGIADLAALKNLPFLKVFIPGDGTSIDLTPLHDMMPLRYIALVAENEVCLGPGGIYFFALNAHSTPFGSVGGIILGIVYRSSRGETLFPIDQ